MLQLICFSKVKGLVIALFLLVSTIASSQEDIEFEAEIAEQSTPIFNHQLSAGIGLHSSFSKDWYIPPSGYPTKDELPHGGYYWIFDKIRPVFGLSHTIISKWGISFKTEVNYFNDVFIQQSNIDSIKKHLPDSINTFLYYRYASNDIELRISLGFCKKRFRGFVGLKTAFLMFPFKYKEDRHGTVSKDVSARFLKRHHIYPTVRIYYVFNYKGKFQFPVFVGVDVYSKSQYDFLLGVEMTFFNK